MRNGGTGCNRVLFRRTRAVSASGPRSTRCLRAEENDALEGRPLFYGLRTILVRGIRIRAEWNELEWREDVLSEKGIES